MKSFSEFLQENRTVSFDYSKEPRSAIGFIDADKLVKSASILSDGGINERKFRIAVIYANPRRDDGRSMDVFPDYKLPACSNAAELKALKPEVDDRHGVIADAIKQFEESSLATNLEK